MSMGSLLFCAMTFPSLSLQTFMRPSTISFLFDDCVISFIELVIADCINDFDADFVCYCDAIFDALLNCQVV